MTTSSRLSAAAVLERVGAISDRFAQARQERQLRRELDPQDFADLAEAGFLMTGVPAEDGGLWEDVARSTRPVSEILRRLARGDPSVALVSSMHPAVLSFWLSTPVVPEEYTAAWAGQRAEVTAAAAGGAWWGTITSEPGSGGDVSKTKTSARPDGDGSWRLSGVKHFGSGSGITSFMITTALPEGEETPDWFFVDVRGSEWDGTDGIKLIAPWDGHGMTATQSHGFSFGDVKAARFAWPGNLELTALNAGPFVGCAFTAVILGIVDEAISVAREELRPKSEGLRAYEQVEWIEAEREAWSAVQIYEGMLQAVETEAIPHRHVLMGKVSVAELAESVLRRLCRIVGGGTFARRSPYGFWFEDVRALGFLRPPWPLVTDTLFATAWMDLG